MADSPPSSPPGSISYAFREGSYYTDDQSDDCYGGEANTNPADQAVSDSDDESDSDEEHEQHCNLHADPQATHCNALTRARKKCSYKARVFNEGFLPVCATHEWKLWGLKAGRCQAVEDCGRVCNRFALHAPPYHLCAKHEKGTDTLPCGIMSLPTEIHLMIFRHLFPNVVPTNGLTNNAGAVLRVNRAFYSAASSVLYNELQFKASIDHSDIALLGRKWETGGVNDKYTDINNALCQAGAQRIRKLRIDIRFASRRTKIKGIGTHDIGFADYEVYQVRDAVRKLIDLLRPTTKSQSVSETPALKQVEVRPAPGIVHHWQPDEVVAAIFFVIEPFVALGPIETPALLPCPRSVGWHSGVQLYVDTIINVHKHETYRLLREAWLKSMKNKLATSNQVRRVGQKESLITREYHKIEELWALIQKHESTSATSLKHGWLRSAFQGIERVLHIARMVDMNIDENLSDSLERMEQIRDAITKRWVNAHRQQQRSAFAIAACIGSMSHSEDPADLYPDAFELNTPDPLEHETDVNYGWLELGNADNAPQLGNAGVTYTEDDLRIYIHEGDRTVVRLKTPTLVRRLRFLKVA